MKEKKINVLDKIDQAADYKGSVWVLVWQFIKFTVVSLLVTIIQLALVNILFFALKNYNAPLPLFLDAIFTETTVGVGNNNWGYVLPFFISNLVANTVGYFLNKSKTFKSDAPIWHFVIYIVVLLLLILFATWLQGAVANALISTNIGFFMGAAPTVAGMVAGTLQFVVLFPLQKFVLLRESKKETSNE